MVEAYSIPFPLVRNLGLVATLTVRDLKRRQGMLALPCGAFFSFSQRISRIQVAFKSSIRLLLIKSSQSFSINSVFRAGGGPEQSLALGRVAANSISMPFSMAPL